LSRLVFKVGSHVITANGELCLPRLRALVDLLALLHKEHEILLVSSGAVAAGHTKFPKIDNKTTVGKQALSAIGQALIINRYQQEFDDFNITVGQILITLDDFTSFSHSDNAKNAIESLLSNGVIPIINENDSIVTDELLRGDNDALSAHVANFVEADMLVILSDIEGYCDKNPKLYDDAKILPLVNTLSQAELTAEATPGESFATGGIVTKLKAAQILLDQGRQMYLASGFDLSGVRNFLLKSGEAKGTLFTRSH
jgi:glutamate 5-kinase